MESLHAHACRTDGAIIFGISYPPGNDHIWSSYSDLTRPFPPDGGLVREIPGYFRKIWVGEI